MGQWTSRYHPSMHKTQVPRGASGYDRRRSEADESLFILSVPRIYEIWSIETGSHFHMANSNSLPVECRSLNGLLVRKLSYGQVTCARSLRELPIRLQSGSRIDQISSMRGTACTHDVNNNNAVYTRVELELTRVAWYQQ